MSKLNSVHDIDQKIEELKKRKERLKRQQAESFYRKLESYFDNRFSPELVLGIIHDQLESASPEQIKKWQEVGATFFRDSSKKNHKDRTTDQSTKSTKSQDDDNLEE